MHLPILLALSASPVLPAPATPSASPLQGDFSTASDVAVPLRGMHGLGVALEGDTLLAGAPNALNPIRNPNHRIDELVDGGLVVVYDQGSSGWNEAQILRPSISNEADAFGTNIQLDGDLALISAPGAIVHGVRSGAVFVFERAAGQWSETGMLVPNNARRFAAFGSHMDLDGDRVLIGAPFHSEDGILEWGRAYVFERGPGGWSEVDEIVPAAMPDKSWVGYRVALEGDRAVLGVYGDNTDGIDAGALCVVERAANGDWVIGQMLRASQPIHHAHLGFSVDLQGDTIVAATLRGGLPGLNHGTVHVYTLSNSVWSETQRLLPLGLGNGESFGQMIQFTEAGRLLVGMPGFDGGTGRLAIYDAVSPGTYKMAGMYAAPGGTGMHLFGYRFTFDGDRLAVSQPLAPVAGLPRGSVLTFEPTSVATERPYCMDPSGQGGQPFLFARGVHEANAGTLELVLGNAPDRGVAILMSSPTSVGSSQSPLCLGGQVARHGFRGLSGSGTESFVVNAATIGLAPGTSRMFQVWTSNGGVQLLSNATAIVMAP